MDKWRIKKGDTVQVIAGKDKGKRGEILSVERDARRVVVKDVNVVTRHEKPSMTSAGGLVKTEKSLHASIVMLIDSTDDKPTRVGFKVVDGKKVRFSKRTGALIG